MGDLQDANESNTMFTFCKLASLHRSWAVIRGERKFTFYKQNLSLIRELDCRCDLILFYCFCVNYFYMNKWLLTFNNGKYINILLQALPRVNLQQHFLEFKAGETCGSTKMFLKKAALSISLALIFTLSTDYFFLFLFLILFSFNQHD